MRLAVENWKNFYGWVIIDNDAVPDEPDDTLARSGFPSPHAALIALRFGCSRIGGGTKNVTANSAERRTPEDTA